MANTLNIFLAYLGSRNSGAWRLASFSSAAVSVVLITGCGTSPAPADVPLKTDGVGQTTRQEETGRNWVDPILSSDENETWQGRKAWRQFIADGGYRLARFEDFSFSAKVKDEIAKINGRPYGRDETFGLGLIYLFGDFDHEGQGDWRRHDLVAIVVDVQKTDANRFGIVAFNALKDGAGYGRPIWIYKDADLSKVHLGAWSGGVSISRYDDEGRIGGGFLNWNRKTQRYSFDADYRAPR